MKHLKEHGEHGYLKEAVAFLMENKSTLSFTPEEVISQVHHHGHAHHGGGCPGSQTITFDSTPEKNDSESQPSKSKIRIASMAGSNASSESCCSLF